VIVVHVEHFLNAEGVDYFPQWILEARQVLGRFDGFRSIRQLEWVDDPQSCHLWLEFDDLDLLRRWSASEAHDELIDRLEAYRIKKQESKIFRVV
jgi:antibiotic biosynthesis monooxygenase (ABM) superfamily enzyme